MQLAVCVCVPVRGIEKEWADRLGFVRYVGLYYRGAFAAVRLFRVLRQEQDDML
jgi:hypothetical protein